MKDVVLLFPACVAREASIRLYRCPRCAQYRAHLSYAAGFATLDPGHLPDGSPGHLVLVRGVSSTTGMTWSRSDDRLGVSARDGSRGTLAPAPSEGDGSGALTDFRLFRAIGLRLVPAAVVPYHHYAPGDTELARWLDRTADRPPKTEMSLWGRELPLGLPDRFSGMIYRWCGSCLDQWVEANKGNIGAIPIAADDYDAVMRPGVPQILGGGAVQTWEIQTAFWPRLPVFVRRHFAAVDPEAEWTWIDGRYPRVRCVSPIRVRYGDADDATTDIIPAGDWLLTA